MKTVKAFLKAAIKLKSQSIMTLKGYEKLTEREQYLVSSLTADMDNDMGEDEFQEILKKFKL
jgi:hypothetical protein